MTQVEMNEEGLAALIASQVPWREELHGHLAVEAARCAKIFQDNDDGAPSWLDENAKGISRDTTGLEAELDPPACRYQPSVLGIQNATEDDIRRFLGWKEQMSQDIHSQNPNVDITPITHPMGTADHGSVSQLSISQSHQPPAVCYFGENGKLAEAALTPVDPSMLWHDQFHAYDIVTWHLNQTLGGQKPPPLQMLIHGEGGTGKSKVIQMITKYFISKGMRHTLLKAAYTGVAASLIDGKMTHLM
ncbi:hypothetical protein EDC04DRAFT_2972437 [Pisolithus marmoratus]|nr:hypothetical protein EDC04DRAFT_2972437 [Pisolithus marmoratus]